MWMTGKRMKPSTEPLYSGASRKDYSADMPIDIVDFISGHVKKTEYFVLSQNLMEDNYNVIFGKYSEIFSSCPSSSWGKYSSYDDMLSYIKKDIWGKNKNVHSIAADKNQFVVFGMESFGYEQSIIPFANVDDYWSKNYMITCCFPNGSNFYFVMTKGAPGYPSSKNQCQRKRDSWSKLDEAIKEQWDKGEIITAIAYSNISKEYIAVMTESGQAQRKSWDDFSCESGFMPTVIFQDPSDKKVLYVKTKDVSNVTGWIARSNYNIET